MSKKQQANILLKKLQAKKIIVAYCCCGTKRTASTACYPNVVDILSLIVVEE